MRIFSKDPRRFKDLPSTDDDSDGEENGSKTGVDSETGGAGSSGLSQQATGGDPSGERNIAEEGKDVTE